MGKKKGDTAAKVTAPGEPVYTVMAFITFVALAVGCALVYLDYDEYGKTTAPAEKVPTLTKLGDASATPSGNVPVPGANTPAPAPPGPAPMPMPMTPPGN